MNRPNILLLVVLVHCLGCSDNTTSSSDQQGAATTSSESTDQLGSKEESPPERDSQTIPSIADEPEEDAMTLYRDAQAMMKDGELKAGYDTAQKAMARFIAEDVDLPWLMLESIAAGDKRIDVHFNMGERERDMPDDGIVRPLSFRIWPNGDDSALLQVIDFEIGRRGGQSVTAAIGEMTDTGHANYGILDVDAEYKTIRQQVIDLVTRE
ncbi:MAG: hypothetical protein ABJZ55_05750 [Fuerstiella sp.]